MCESSHGLPALRSWHRQGKVVIQHRNQQFEIKQQCTGLCESLRDTNPTIPLLNLQPSFVLFNTLSCSHKNHMNTHKLQYTGVFFFYYKQTNKKNQCFSCEEHIYKKINNKLITRRAPFHTLYPLLYGSLQHTLYSVLPHLEGTCFPLKVLSPKLCFLGLTMCAASGCNPISQTVKGNAVFNYLAFTS